MRVTSSGAAASERRASGLRVLGRVRLSVATDESTSIERQREVIAQWAETNGHNVVGWAEDSDVSGAVSPFDTPGLGDWLNNRADEFDTIAAWKLDRISRSAIRLNVLIGWCIDHDKSLVSTTEGIDIGTAVGRLIANVIAFLAEGELEAMRDRQRSSRRKLRETARWPGGKPPYGYQVVDSPSGGKVLEIDPHAYNTVRRIVDQVLDGVPLARVCADLNQEGVPSPADHYRICRDGEDDGEDTPWRTWAMRLMLLSPTLVGHAHLGGQTVRDDEGNPVLMCTDPLVTDDERELIAAELARAAGEPRERVASAPLVGLVRCWFCDTPLTTSRQNKTLTTGLKYYRYYRCPNNCTPLLPAETAEEHAERALLDSMGDEQVTERVWVPGDSHEVELKEAVRAFEELFTAAGRMTSRTAKDRLQRQLAALDSRIAELEAKPAREGRYENRPTGETYREAWEKDTDPNARRDLLKRVGVGFRAGIHEGQMLFHVVEMGDRLPD